MSLAGRRLRAAILLLLLPAAGLFALTWGGWLRAAMVGQVASVLVFASVLCLVPLLGALLWLGKFSEVVRWAERWLRRGIALWTPDPGATWFHWAEGAPDLHRAREWLSAAATEGHAEARMEEALALLGGSFGTGGWEVGAARMGQLAREGNREAAFHFAECLRWGRGTPRDPKAALTWYRRSGEAGFGPAAAWLAKAFETGDGVEPDAKEADAWAHRLVHAAPIPPRGLLARLLAEEPSAFVQAWAHGAAITTQIGDAVVRGGLGRPLVTGFATCGGGLALTGLLMVLLYGGPAILVFAPPFLMLVALGVSLHRSNRGSRQSRALLARAESGEAEACFRHGAGFEHGSPDHPKDAASARVWYQRAAEGGHAEAAYRLGELFAWGQGGPRDRTAARAWLIQAMQAGHARAKVRLADLDSHETDADP
jgi:TPR repeat protein